MPEMIVADESGCNIMATEAMRKTDAGEPVSALEAMILHFRYRSMRDQLLSLTTHSGGLDIFIADGDELFREAKSHVPILVAFIIRFCPDKVCALRSSNLLLPASGNSKVYVCGCKSATLGLPLNVDADYVETEFKKALESGS